MTNEKWRKYQAWLNYPASLTSKDESRRKEAREYISKATQGFDKNWEILVLGCGDGYEVKMIKEAGFNKIKGITFADQEYQNARTMGLEEEVVQGDIHELPFANEIFDAVISKETLEHLLSPFIALCEINRVMKIHAKFVHYIPTGSDKQRDWYHLNCFPEYIWIDLMHKTGFEVKKVFSDIAQLRYEGNKLKNKDSINEAELYDLGLYMARVRQ